MKNLSIKFENINNSEKIYNLDKTTSSKINKNDSWIKKELKNFPPLNILYKKNLLDITIEKTIKFSKNKNKFIIFGTGGSNLGSRALINTLCSKEKKIIKFYDNVDPISFQTSMQNINVNSTGFIIISKSGQTPETLSQFACLIELFIQINKIKEFYQNCLIITENNSNPLRKIAKNNNCMIIDHESDIGGRFSVFSSVGMVPAIIAGLDVNKIHKGAIDIIDNIENDNYLNLIKLLPELFAFSDSFKNIKTSVLMTYSDSLYFFGKWYLQLWAESVGKLNKGITPIHSIGTTDQHSQLQLFLDGPKDKFFTFISTNHSNKGLKINYEILNEKPTSYLAGKYMGDLMEAEQKATINTFIKKKFYLREIHIPNVDEFSIGQLMALSIVETILTCRNLEIDAFNQPAVEEGKLLTKEYLSS